MAMKDLDAGKPGTYYTPFPVLALVGDGNKTFLTAGGGGSRSTKEVPNVVHAHEYDEATGKLNAIAALDTGKTVVVGLSYCKAASTWLASAKNLCKVLSLDTQKKTLTELCEFETESQGKAPEQNFAKFSPDGKMIVTGGTDGQVKLWKCDKPAEIPKLLRDCGAKTKEIVDADFSDDSKLLAACDDSGVCRLWDLGKEDDQEGQVFTFETSAVKGRIFIKLCRFIQTAEGQALIFGANGPRGPAFVGIYGLDGTKKKEAKVGEEPLKCLTFDSSYEKVCVGMASGFKTVFSCPNLKVLKKSKVVHELPTEAVAMLGAKTVVSGSGDRSLHFLDCTPDNNLTKYIIFILACLIIMQQLALMIAMKQK